MRRGILVVVLSVFALSSAYSGDANKAKQIVDRGIKAAGGEEVLKKHQAATFREKGTYYGMGQGLPYTANSAIQYPDKFRMEIEGIFTMAFDGKKGWTKMGDMTKLMDEQELAAHAEGHRASWVTSLLPLKDKAFMLSVVGETKVDNRPATTVKVTRKGYPDVDLSFDEKTGLLVRAEYRVKAPDQGFQEVSQEVGYQDYKTFDGALVPTKFIIKREGKLYVEAEVLEMKAVGQLDASMFAAP